LIQKEIQHSINQVVISKLMNMNKLHKVHSQNLSKIKLKHKAVQEKSQIKVAIRVFNQSIISSLHKSNTQSKISKLE